MSRRTLADVVLAGAAGDAIGYPLELLTVAQIRRRYGNYGLRAPIFREPASQALAIGVATQLTLATMDGILWSRDRNDSLEAGMYRAYMRWYYVQTGREPRYGQKSWLKKQRYEVDFNLAKVPEFALPRRPHPTTLDALAAADDKELRTATVAHNDSDAMLCMTPIGYYRRGDAEQAYRDACRCAELMQTDAAVIGAAGTVAALFARISAGDTLRQALRYCKKASATWGTPETVVAALDTATRAAESIRRTRRALTDKTQWWYYVDALDEVGTESTAETTLAIGLACALAYRGARYAVLAAANQNGNSAAAALTAQLVAANHTESEIPAYWLTQLECRRQLQQLAAQVEAVREESAADEQKG